MSSPVTTPRPWNSRFEAVVSTPPPNPPDERWNALVVEAGGAHYQVYCSRCHGGETHSLNIIPDLRRSAALTSAALWKNIVIDGAFEPNGMIGWSEFLTASDAESIRAYVGVQARILRDAETPRTDAAAPPNPAANAL